MRETLNDFVACKPFPKHVGPKKQDNGLGFGPGATNTLIKTEVVLTPSMMSVHWINRGDVVYLDGRCVLEKWAVTVFELDGVQFVLVPKDKLLIVDRADPKVQDSGSSK